MMYPTSIPDILVMARPAMPECKCALCTLRSLKSVDSFEKLDKMTSLIYFKLKADL